MVELHRSAIRATPTLAVIEKVPPSLLVMTRRWMASRRRSQTFDTVSNAGPTATIPNSSPPTRAKKQSSVAASRMISATCLSAISPTVWP